MVAGTEPKTAVGVLDHFKNRTIGQTTGGGSNVFKLLRLGVIARQTGIFASHPDVAVSIFYEAVNGVGTRRLVVIWVVGKVGKGAIFGSAGVVANQAGIARSNPEI